jgi:NitT/TauT family transport system permease protein
MKRISWQAMLAFALCLLAAFNLPLTAEGAPVPVDAALTFAIFALILGGLGIAELKTATLVRALALIIGAQGAAFALLKGISGSDGMASASFFCLLAAAWLAAWRLVTILSQIDTRDRTLRLFLRLFIPFVFGLWILLIWEAVTRGAGVPFVLLPPPSAIGVRIASSLPILGADVRQTIFKAVLAGYFIGSAAGFLAAILADRIDFLRRGLLPIGNLVSALPIIGIAPIMVMWFGFDWPSKAAVVVVMTFFPMLVNAVAGLSAAGHMERDLMSTYASDYWQTLFRLRLPAASPFIFNALKINSTLALIGAIVAEFFGTPIVGMGFRISTEVGRMNIDMVWAEIAVAAVAGSIFYGLVALAERAVTFWHPSIRGG